MNKNKQQNKKDLPFGAMVKRTPGQPNEIVLLVDRINELRRSEMEQKQADILGKYRLKSYQDIKEKKEFNAAKEYKRAEVKGVAIKDGDILVQKVVDGKLVVITVDGQKHKLELE